MIPVELLIIPDDVVDLPTNNFKQFQPSRPDRINDRSKEQLRLMEANDEAPKQPDTTKVRRRTEGDEKKKKTKHKDTSPQPKEDNRGNIELKDEERRTIPPARRRRSTRCPSREETYCPAEIR
jgi:hypothetical protein